MSTHSKQSVQNVAIVGGGIASLVAGITLREKLPDAAITLYTADNETLLGGQLASWNEGAYPVEHGLHALFGFYDHVLPILKKIGAYDNLTRSQEHIFIREREEIHRFDLRTWPATYRGLTATEKIRLLAVVPVIGKLMLDFKRRGGQVFDAYDQSDLRELARRHGVPESVLQSNFFRQFYEAAFNAPSELSAAVGLGSIYRIFSKRWHYYFNLPTRDSIIGPLQHHFTHVCHGRIEFNHKLIKVHTDDMGLRATGLEFESKTQDGRLSVQADQYLLALGLEDFKRVDFGEIATRHDYFRNVHKLQTVSSFSIQAWFKEDPVPLGIDSMITGMPEPFGILCPITRVRAMPPPEELPLRHELIATGPERGYEDIPDDKIKTNFITGLRNAGFKIPDDPLHMHVVLRRNRESFNRYLLTQPGELQWRPAHQSPLENLYLAGAWVRNEFALPCVEAAAQGAIKAAGFIAARCLASRDRAVGRSTGPSHDAPRLLPPPYRFPYSTGSFFLLNAHRERLAGEIAGDLALFPGLADKLLFAVLRHEDVHARCDPSDTRYAYNEVLLAAFVREKGVGAIGRMGLYPLSVYVDDNTAMAAGRDVYGFPKRLARIELGARELNVDSGMVAAEAACGPVRQGRWMSANWSVEVQGSCAGRLHFLLASLGYLGRLVAFYNTRHMTGPGPRERSDIDSCELTHVSLTNVQVRGVSSLNEFRLRVDESTDDLYPLLAQPVNDTGEVCARRGVKVDLAFSMGPGRIVEAAQCESTGFSSARLRTKAGLARTAAKSGSL